MNPRQETQVSCSQVSYSQSLRNPKAKGKPKYLALLCSVLHSFILDMMTFGRFCTMYEWMSRMYVLGTWVIWLGSRQQHNCRKFEQEIVVKVNGPINCSQRILPPIHVSHLLLLESVGFSRCLMEEAPKKTRGVSQCGLAIHIKKVS